MTDLPQPLTPADCGKPKRVGISKKTRFEVFKRDGFACQYCGAHPPDVILEPDHIDPVANGGTNHIDNLVTSCFDCNRGKGARLLSCVPQSLSEKSKELAEREEQLLGYRAIMQATLDRIELDMWEVADALIPGSSTEGMRRDWLRSIKMFNEKLPLHIVLDAAEIARASRTYTEKRQFAYFCGVCWNKIRGN